MMDVGDLNGDGKQEIIAGTSSGFITVLDNQAKKLWAKAISSPPTVVKLVKGTSGNWICVGCEDGNILALDSKGSILYESRVSGKPSSISLMNHSNEMIAVIQTESGEINGFTTR
jgi:outer membrane protein assembly factor BamB